MYMLMDQKLSFPPTIGGNAYPSASFFLGICFVCFTDNHICGMTINSTFNSGRYFDLLGAWVYEPAIAAGTAVSKTATLW